MRRLVVIRKDDERVVGEGCVLSDGRVVMAATTVQMEPMLYKTETKMAEDWGQGCTIEYIDAPEDSGT
jgi:hypothetical protein